ncbi:Dual specificity mitogen-activated protein kinase kinase 5 [Bagarius yarrelli]|uniref:Dual specificity mitogen-activated protein kinase kinase 5 n=1 Tax=Bagarius yarrelli TaxID=175774 RepID=A0A556TLC5_BAGYA|nr:Dual specificity mitogen-activated protein kinase kinase 5 [Bagarius yarrelli]
MDTEGIVIRIKTPMGDMDSSVDCPSLLSFNDLLIAIRDVMPEATITAFEYEDEVGDRITVRSDEELKAMLSYVNTRHGSSSSQGSSPAESFSNNSLKKSSAELKKILTNGQINEQDIQYQEQLGHGNGGTVYKACHLLGNRVLAVKVIPLDITAELQKQIMSELEILYKCDSPYIIKFYSAFFVENRISICTEFMDGGSLDVYRKIPEHVLGRIAVALVNSIAKTYVGTNAYMADPPVLPISQFSEKFVHFITQCMKKQPKERPAPNNLMEHAALEAPAAAHDAAEDKRANADHPFITQYDDGNTEVVSMWVCRSLEDRKSQQAQGVM